MSLMREVVQGMASSDDESLYNTLLASGLGDYFPPSGHPIRDLKESVEPETRVAAGRASGAFRPAGDSHFFNREVVREIVIAIQSEGFFA